MNKTMNKKLNKIKTEIKAEANKKEKAEVETPRVKLNALQRISGGEIEPKSELRVVCKRLLPVSLAGLFALLSGVAIYTTLRTVLFYRNYGENSALLLSLFLFALLLALIYMAAYSLQRSEWGYRFRFIFLTMLMLAVAVGSGAVLFSGPTGSLGNRIGLGDRLRPEDRIFASSNLMGRVEKIDGDSVTISLGSGPRNVERAELVELSLTGRARLIPKDARLKVGQRVIVLADEGGNIEWIKILNNS